MLRREKKPTSRKIRTTNSCASYLMITTFYYTNRNNDFELGYGPILTATSFLLFQTETIIFVYSTYSLHLFLNFIFNDSFDFDAVVFIVNIIHKKKFKVKKIEMKNNKFLYVHVAMT